MKHTICILYAQQVITVIIDGPLRKLCLKPSNRQPWQISKQDVLVATETDLEIQMIQILKVQVYGYSGSC